MKNQLNPSSNALQNAQYNEINRIILASYKEGYFNNDNTVYFRIIANSKCVKLISSYESAQEAIYTVVRGVKPKVVGVLSNEEIEINTSEQLLNILKPFLKEAFPGCGFSEERWQNWLKASIQSVYNEAIAIENKFRLDNEIASYKSVIDYAQNLTPNESYNFFNRYAAFFGRYDMPFSKMRLPLINRESLIFAPELGNDVPIVFGALNIKYAIVKTVGPQDCNSFFAMEFPELYSIWLKMLSDRQKDHLEYIVFPIHPLSLGLFQVDLAEIIQSGNLFWDENIFLKANGSLSYRTMVPVGRTSKPVIKLPVPLQMTGYIRHIDWQEIQVGPELSRFVQLVLEKEQNFGGKIRLSRDLFSACVTLKPHGVEITAQAQNYSFLLRENQSMGLSNGEITMPLASLFSTNSVTGKAVFIELMEKVGVDSVSKAKNYLEKYTNMVIGSILSFYLRSGIMLEAHQQNLGLSIAKDGNIRQLHYHDIPHAIFIYKPVFLSTGADEKTISSLPFVSDEIDPSCTQFIHTVLQLNLFPIVELISNRYKIEKRELLAVIAKVIRNTLKNERCLVQGLAVSRRQLLENFIDAIESRILDSETFLVKRLLGRLYVQSQTPHWGEVPNYSDSYLAVYGTRIPIKNPIYGLN